MYFDLRCPITPGNSLSHFSSWSASTLKQKHLQLMISSWLHFTDLRWFHLTLQNWFWWFYDCRADFYISILLNLLISAIAVCTSILISCEKISNSIKQWASDSIERLQGFLEGPNPFFSVFEWFSSGYHPDSEQEGNLFIPELSSWFTHSLNWSIVVLLPTPNIQLLLGMLEFEQPLALREDLKFNYTWTYLIREQALGFCKSPTANLNCNRHELKILEFFQLILVIC